MIYSTYLVNLQSLFLLTIFTIISFLDINRKNSFEKKIFLVCNFLVNIHIYSVIFLSVIKNMNTLDHCINRRKFY